MELSTFIKNLRIAHSLTTTEIAKELNVSVAEWSEAELKSDYFFLNQHLNKLSTLLMVDRNTIERAIAACKEYEDTGSIDITHIEKCIASLKVDKQLLDRLFRGLPRQGPTKERAILKRKIV